MHYFILSKWETFDYEYIPILVYIRTSFPIYWTKFLFNENRQKKVREILNDFFTTKTNFKVVTFLIDQIITKQATIGIQ